VVLFDAERDTLIERLTGRWTNPRTGRTYHAKFNPPKVAGIDDEDGGPLVQRRDDTPTTWSSNARRRTTKRPRRSSTTTRRPACSCASTASADRRGDAAIVLDALGPKDHERP
jgi:hypothetical protein